MIQKKFSMLAKTLMGLENILAQELEEHGAEKVEIGKRAVSFQGDLRMLYKANLRLRTALKILVPIAEFEARDENDLYYAVKKIKWSKYLDVEHTFAIDTTVYSEHFTHSKYVAFKAKDAIVDRFRERENKRPSIDVEDPDLRIHIHVRDRSFTLSLDSSGKPLNMRGYRVGNHPAIINEVLAAGLIQLSKWDKKTTLIDPFCGSGTLLIEAAMLAQNVAPNLNRKAFCFKHWKNFDKMLWVDVRMESIEEQEDNFPKIIGIDISERSIDTAQKNFDAAPIQQKNIQLNTGDFNAFEPDETKGMVITNPPYGERLQEHDIEELYTKLGNRLKNHFQGHHAWVISTKDALKYLGLHASPKYAVKNGPLDCKFQHYEVYEGSKKD